MIYNYKCKSCEHEQELVLRMADRTKPMETPCPECDKMDVIQHHSGGTASLVAGVNVDSKMSDGWKEVIRGVKNNNPTNNIKSY